MSIPYDLFLLKILKKNSANIDPIGIYFFPILLTNANRPLLLSMVWEMDVLMYNLGTFEILGMYGNQFIIHMNEHIRMSSNSREQWSSTSQRCLVMYDTILPNAKREFEKTNICKHVHLKSFGRKGNTQTVMA